VAGPRWLVPGDLRFSVSRCLQGLRIVSVDVKVHSPVIPTPWIEATPTLRTLTPTAHILIDRQHVSALPTKYRLLVPLGLGPDARLVRLAHVVTADAGVELLAAEVLNGDDVERRMPVSALRKWRDRKSVNYWRIGIFGRRCGIKHTCGGVQAAELRLWGCRHRRAELRVFAGRSVGRSFIIAHRALLSYLRVREAVVSSLTSRDGGAVIVSTS
jgi:hypothetical protein